MRSIPTLGIGLAALVAGGLFVILRSTPAPMSAGILPNEGTPYHEITNPSGFVNTGDVPITIGEYVGQRVILLDVMTYSCINCQRTFPYVTAWYEKYKDQGLIVIGIHTPEFAFEKDKKNVEEAMRRFGINFPVVLDNEYGTWNAYGNSYWPRKYLIDIHGNVVYDHIGEGAYEETEMKIRELLNERAIVLGEKRNFGDELEASRMPKKELRIGSPETYFGAARNQYLGNGQAGVVGTQTLGTPEIQKQNVLYLSGTWDIREEYAASVSESVVMYSYNASEVYIVGDADVSITVEVLQDGQPIGTAAGADVDAQGFVHIKESRLYKLIKNQTPGPHVLELRIGGKNLRLYAFTFG